MEKITETTTLKWKLFWWEDENNPEIKNYYLANGNYSLDIDLPLDEFCKKYRLSMQQSSEEDPIRHYEEKYIGNKICLVEYPVIGHPLLVGKPDLLIKDKLTDLETLQYQYEHGSDELWIKKIERS